MRPVHLEIEVLYDTTFTTACGSNAAKNVTVNERQVTCRKCLAALGYALPEKAEPVAERLAA